jgi:transposase
VLYNDDTTIRILEMMGQRARKAPPPKDDGDPGRTGLFTSGVVATRAGVRIALFFSGPRHAGENLSHVLQHRAAQLESPVQMCDGLARNLPKNSTRFWQTVWRTAVATSWNFTIGFLKNVVT